MSAGPELPGTAESWLGRQRWYRAKGSSPRLRSIGGFRLTDPAAEADVFTHLLEDTSVDPPTLYQMPVTYRRSTLPDAQDSLLGTINDHDGELFVYDAPHDPAFARALLALVTGEGATAPDPDARVAAAGHLLREPTAIEVATSRVFDGEQSNTSLVLELKDARGHAVAPVICKLFRTLEPGENPDIVVQSALTAAGCRRIPALLGYVSGFWPPRNPGAEEATLSGQLALVQEFVADAEDAWRLALDSAATNVDFTGLAWDLGVATAEVHEILAAAMGTEEPTARVIQRVTAGMRERLDAAVTEVPELGPYRGAVENLITAAGHDDWPPLQQIHGDFHLGQVIFSPSRGWIVLDFEGEPLRPLAARSTRDLGLRDLAGMLRSFDYAAETVARNRVGVDSAPAATMHRWAEDAQHSFLAGYQSRSGLDLECRGALLAALEVDKALYETIYESRNRPDWLPIPLTAIHRLVTPNE